MPVAKVDSRVRAEFKEWAREIIRRDREARKYGQSQNTIGEIERALMKAFRMGRTPSPDADIYSSQSDPDFIDWIEISPRARDALWEISSPLHVKKANESNPQIFIERLEYRPRERWVAVGDRGDPNAHTFSAGGIVPLIKLGLLGSLEGPGDLLVLTPKGIATCKEYWRRWDENDPTLPIMSMRP